MGAGCSGPLPNAAAPATLTARSRPLLPPDGKAGPHKYHVEALEDVDGAKLAASRPFQAEGAGSSLRLMDEDL